MSNKPNVISIDGVNYIKEGDFKPAESVDGMKLCMIRSTDAGVFYGYIKSSEFTPGGRAIVVNQCKRIHGWAGACSITQLALEGTKKPKECRITDPTDNHEIMGIIELIPMTDVAKKSLDEVEIWKV